MSDVRRSRAFSVIRMALGGLVLAAGGVTGCSGSSGNAGQRPVPTPVTQDGMTLDWGHDVKAQALSLIDQSGQYCYLDIYELSDPQILSALAAARRRGVDVRVVVDATESHSRQSLPTLKGTGVPTETLAIHSGISHIKMLVTEGGVLIGGMNFGAASWNNNDASVYLRHPNPSFLALFRWDWQRAQGLPAAAPAYQRPLLDDRAAESAIVQAIQSAQGSVAMEAFDLSDRAVLTALAEASGRGVQVEILLDPGQYLNRRNAQKLRDAGGVVRFYSPYGGEWMHAKILDVDHGATFVIGSANFSHQAYTYNHEGDIELHGVTAFDEALQNNLAAQMGRGTDSPARASTSY